MKMELTLKCPACLGINIEKMANEVYPIIKTVKNDQLRKMNLVFNPSKRTFGLGHNIGHSVGWVERSETQQLIDVGFRSSTQPTGNSYGLKYDHARTFHLLYLIVSIFFLINCQTCFASEEIRVGAFENSPLSTFRNGQWKGDQKMISLSDDEKAWLAEHPSIKLGFNPNMQPLLSQDGNNDPTGILPDIFQHLEILTGLNILIEINPWHMTIEKVRKGEIDGLAACVPALAKETAYQQPRDILQRFLWSLPENMPRLGLTVLMT